MRLRFARQLTVIRRRKLLWPLLGALLALLIAAPSAGAAVSTDQTAYSPGATVTISGDNSDNAGYLPGETVSVAVAGPSGYTASCGGTADSTGAWSCQVTIPSDTSAIGLYGYTATGQTSGVSQSGGFSDSGCKNQSALSTPLNSTDIRAASTTDAGTGTATYTISTPNDSPSGGIPGLIEYCVYTSPLPDTATASYDSWQGAVDSSGGFFDFERPNGDPTNLPFDGTTQTVGHATWNSLTLPSSQTIVLHINDPTECGNLYGAGTLTCFVLPATAKDLTVSKTATPSFTRTYKWGITKSVDQTKQDIAQGGSATFNYTISVTHDSGTDSNWQVTGKITVSNPNSFAVSGVDVTDTIDNNGSCAVDNGTGVTVPANGSAELSYTCTYGSAPSPASGTNTATATWPAAVGSPHTSATGTASYDFGPVKPTIVDGSVKVSDPLDSQSPRTFSYTQASPQTFTYSTAYSGDPGGTCTSHTNTATFTTSDIGTTGSASQTVKTCVGADLTVTKVATASFTRTYTWSITKSVDNTTQDIVSGGSATFNYTVSVTHDSGTDSNWQVTGDIKVTNPNDWEAVTLTNLADAIDNGGTCAVSNGSPGNVNPTAGAIPASATVDFPYTCTYSSAPRPSSGTNTATATWDKTTYSTPSGSASGSAGVDFGKVNPTIVDGGVSVSDSLGGPLGTVSYTDTSPKTFTYPYTFSGDPAGTCTSHNNTATFTTSDTNTIGSASQTVKVCVGKDLTVTKGASAAFTRTYKWSITKSVGNSTQNIASGGSATFNYTVSVTHDNGTDGNWQITGDINVANPNDWEAVTLTNLADAIDNGGTCTVSNGSPANVNPTGGAIPASTTVDFPYTCTYSSPPSPVSATNKATATWDKTKYSTPSGSASGSAAVDFSKVNPTIVDGGASVSDTLGGPLGTVSYTDTSPKTFTYPYTFSGDPAGTCTSHNNTATSTTSDTNTIASASQTVKVCVGKDLTVTKGASAAFTRTYKWGISKGVDKALVSQGSGQYTFNYTVTVTHDSGTDGNWQVTGHINVTNPNNWESITLNLSDAIDNGGTCTVSNGSPANVNPTGGAIPASTTVDFPYTCTYSSPPSPVSATNKATATWDSTKYSTPSGSAIGTAAVDFSKVTATIVDGSVSVTDPLDPQSPHTVSSTDASPTSFKYSRTVAVPTAGCQSYNNTATFTTNTTHTTGSASKTVTLCRTGVLTDTQLCTFDVDGNAPGSQMHLIYTPDVNNPSVWKLNASNPGQFYYNVIYAGSGNTTINITLPYPWVTQGAVPIHVYDGVTTTTSNGQACLTPGNELANSSTQVTLSSYSSQSFGSTTTVSVNLPSLSRGIAYINIHLDYGLKGTTGYKQGGTPGSCNSGTYDAIDATTLAVRIPDCQSYTFSDSLGGSGMVQNENVFKKDPGIGGLLQSSVGDPRINVPVKIYSGSTPTGTPLGTVYSDQDGWYMWQYKYTGKAATFTVNLPTYNTSQTVTLKSNGFLVVSWNNLP